MNPKTEEQLFDVLIGFVWIAIISGSIFVLASDSPLADAVYILLAYLTLVTVLQQMFSGGLFAGSVLFSFITVVSTISYNRYELLFQAVVFLFLALAVLSIAFRIADYIETKL